MTRRKTETLRTVPDSERKVLEQLSRSDREPAGQVAHAKGRLAVTAGQTYTEAAVAAGRKTGDSVARWVSEFNRQGLAALERQHAGGPACKYGPAKCERILTEVRRQPTPEQDGTATWSLQLLCRSLRRAPDGLPTVSEDTIRTVLLAAGFTWQQSRSWRQIGQVLRKRKSGSVTVVAPDAEAKKTARRRLYTGREVGLGGLESRRGGAVSNQALSGRQLAAQGPTGAPSARVHPQWHGENADPVSSALRCSAHPRGDQRHQRGPASLAQGAVYGDFGNRAAPKRR